MKIIKIEKTTRGWEGKIRDNRPGIQGNDRIDVVRRTLAIACKKGPVQVVIPSAL